MPEYTENEKRNMATVEAMFAPGETEEKVDLFADDAVWWNGLPFVGEPGQTEHKGKEAIRGILVGSGTRRSSDSGVDVYDLSTSSAEDVIIHVSGEMTSAKGGTVWWEEQFATAYYQNDEES